MRLFGVEIKRAKDDNKKVVSFVNKEEQDGSTNYNTFGALSSFVDMEGSARTEADLVNKYRSMMLTAEVASAVDDIVNEAIVINSFEEPITCNTDKVTGVSEGIKKKIREEFDYCLSLMDFSNQGYDIFSKWYVDGRIYFHAVVDNENLQKGILELRYIDPRKITKINEYKEEKTDNNVTVKVLKNEYYLYTDNSFANNKLNNKFSGAIISNNGIKIAKDSIISSNSGILNTESTIVLSYLHQAYKPLNQLRMLEDAMTIYRISRAPERRVFYIDVGGMNRFKAAEYIRDMMVKHTNKISYDSTTGEIRDDRNFLTMTDDYWMPRIEGGRGTEIVPLNGGATLGETGDLDYMQKKLYKSLRVPISRLESDTMFQLGRTSEISRDEIKFSKFINRLRVRFSMVFDRFLEIQLILKGVITEEDWEKIRNQIKYDFKVDNHFEELKNLDVYRERISLLGDVEQFVGIYFSRDFVKRNILFQTEDEIVDMKKQMEVEEKDSEEKEDKSNNTDDNNDDEEEKSNNEDEDDKETTNKSDDDESEDEFAP